MANTLVAPAELSDFPGAPFKAGIVDSAVATLRLEAGWHIAPAVTETRRVNSYGGTALILPTLYLVDVTEVRDVSGSAPTVLSGWRQTQAGILTRDAGWPVGIEVVEVDMVHGYSETPPEILPLIAEFSRSQLTDSRKSQERIGDWSASFRATFEGTAAASVLSRFTIHTGFG